jgi:hypothetical protein
MCCQVAVGGKYNTNESEAQQIVSASTQLPGISSMFPMQPFAQSSGMQHNISTLMAAQGASHIQLAQRTNGTAVSAMMQPRQEMAPLNMTAQQLYAQNLNASIERQQQMIIQSQMGILREELLAANNQAGTAQYMQTSQDHSDSNRLSREMQAHMQQLYQPTQSNMRIQNQHEQQVSFPAASQQALALSLSTNAYHNPQMMASSVARAGQNQLIHATQSPAYTLSEEGKIDRFSPRPLAPRPLHSHSDQNRAPGLSNAKSA